MRHCGEPDYPIKWCNCTNPDNLQNPEFTPFIKLANALVRLFFQEHANFGFGMEDNCEYCGGLGWVKCAPYDRECANKKEVGI